MTVTSRQIWGASGEIRRIEFVRSHAAESHQDGPVPIRNPDFRPLVDGLDRDGSVGGLGDRSRAAGGVKDCLDRIKTADAGGYFRFRGDMHLWNMMELNSRCKASGFQTENNSRNYDQCSRTRDLGVKVNWNDRLCDIVDANGWSKAEFARRVDPEGWEKSKERIYKYLQRTEPGKKPPPYPKADILPKILKAIGKTKIYLDYGELAPDAEATVGPERPEPRKRIRILGRGAGGDDGEIVLGDDPVGFADMPATLEGVRGAYAVYIHGDSMYPRWFSGDTVFIDPHRPIRIGDFVLVKFQKDEHSEPRGFAKRLVSRTEKEIVLEQYNPQKKIKFSRSIVKEMHYILRPGE